MDALFHIVMAFVGGVMLLRSLKTNLSMKIILILSLASLVITDADHFLPVKTPIFHNIFLLVVLPLPALLYMYSRGKRDYFNYVLALVVMLLGHLLMDMVQGMYGIPLFYPISDELYMMPATWEVALPGEPGSLIISRLAISLLIYFGLIFLLSELFSSD